MQISKKIKFAACHFLFIQNVWCQTAAESNFVITIYIFTECLDISQKFVKKSFILVVRHCGCSLILILTFVKEPNLSSYKSHEDLLHYRKQLSLFLVISRNCSACFRSLVSLLLSLRQSSQIIFCGKENWLALGRRDLKRNKSWGEGKLWIRKPLVHQGIDLLGKTWLPRAKWFPRLLRKGICNLLKKVFIEKR